MRAVGTAPAAEEEELPLPLLEPEAEAPVAEEPLPVIDMEPEPEAMAVPLADATEAATLLALEATLLEADFPPPAWAMK